ncbi:hypothetical protein [Rhizobium phage RHph_X2_26]|nr:hypothetical protein [Rhizobium phage RHph_X2_26]
MAEGIEIGRRVRYQDFACKGIGHVRAINPHNKALYLVEVEEKDVQLAGFVIDAGAKPEGYRLVGSDAQYGNLRMFWLKELEGR